MSDPIKVTIPSRGITLKFPSGSTPEQIKEAIDRDYPRDGRDVAYDIGQDPGYAEQMSLKEYEDLRKFKKENPVGADQIWEGMRGIIDTVGSGLEEGGKAVANLDFINAGEAVGRGVVVGVADLGDMIKRITTWNSAPDTYEDFIAGKKDTPERRAEYDAKLKADFTDFKELQGYQAERKPVIEKSPYPKLTEATTTVSDPTMFVPGVGEVVGLSKIASRGVGAVTKGIGEAARVVTRPAAEVVERLSTAENAIARGVSKLASPITTGVEMADAIARGAVTAGENLANAPTRIGALESLGRAADATKVDRALASVGRYGGDKLIQAGLAGATGAVEGAVIGGALGALADGEEGFYSGLGSGMAAGAVGGTLGNAYYQLSGIARTDAALADFNRFRSKLDDTTKTKIDTVAERDGLDAVVRLMDGAGLLRGQFRDADVNFLNSEEFKAKHKGADARGVQIIEAARPIIDINIDHKRTDYTFGHEIFHALEQIEQLRPQVERIKQEIVGAWVNNPDGSVTQAISGFLSPAEIEIRHKQYMRKLAASGADARAWVNDKTITQKANRVAGELGAEYMARLISGSDPDAMLRGFDGITRKIADYTLLKSANETLRGIAEKLGTGTRSVESIIFKDLNDAPPVVAAALRDVLRARKEMAKRIELIDQSDRGLVINPRDLSNPAAAELAVKAGIAVKDVAGTVRMRDDFEIAKQEEVQSDAVKNVVESTPVADTTKPYLRVVDGNIVGSGIAPEQLKAFLVDPNLSNKVKESLALLAESFSNMNSGAGGNVMFIEYGAALGKRTHPLTRKKVNRYSSGIRLSQREVAPFALKFNKGDVPYVFALDVSKLLAKAGDRASSGKLGPYNGDFNSFVSDAMRYFENASNPSGVHTVELPRMTPERARFINEFFGAKDGTDSVYIRSFRLDRITESRLTNQRVAASELAWQRQKINWSPAEKLPNGESIFSKEGYRIISKNGKHSVYAPTGEQIGIYDTQARAEQKGNALSNAIFNATRSSAGALDPVSYSALREAAPNINFQPIGNQPENAPISGRLTAQQAETIRELKAFYDQVTPARIPLLERDAVESLSTRLINKGVPVADAQRIAAATFDRIKGHVTETAQVISGLGTSDLARMAGTGRPSVDTRKSVNPVWLTSAFEAFRNDKDLAMMKAQQVATQLNKKEQSAAKTGKLVKGAQVSSVRASTIEQGTGFLVGEMTADQKAFGSSLREDPNAAPRVYSSVVEGQKFGSQGNYNVFFEWDKSAPMVITSHHHYGVGNGLTDIHASANVGDKNARSFGNVTAERYITLPSGKRVLDTHLLVGNEGIPAVRAHQLVVSIPESAIADVKKMAKAKDIAAIENTLENVVYSQLVGSNSQGKTQAFTSSGGVAPKVAIQRNRTEAYVLNPDLANVKKVTIVSNKPDEVRVITNNLAKAFANNGAKLPEIVVVSAESGPSINPGRKAITDEYFARTGKVAYMPATPDTPAFKKWFGESKVVDEEGKPRVVYHGTNSDFTSFSDEKLGSNTRTLVKGHFFTDDPNLAGKFANREGANIIPAFLSLQNPKIIDAEGRSVRSVLGAHEEGMARDDGHDGFVVKNVVDAPGYVLTTAKGSSDKPSTLYVAFDPAQIKSAIGNRGSFNSSNPDIRFQPAEKLPNGQSWSTDNNYRVIQKNNGKFRVYAPTGAMIGVEDTLDKSKRLIEKRSR